MKINTKRTITAIIGNILFALPIYLVTKHGSNIDWLILFCSFIPLIITMIFLLIIWGPDIFNREPVWGKEGFSSYLDWYKNNLSHKYHVRPIYIVLLITAFILGFIFLD